MSEFLLINQYFASKKSSRKDVTVGIGDDCAIVNLAKNKQLVVTTDTLVSGVHFAENTSARAIAHKALAVNLSDLAAMGAEPCWVSLALTIPTLDETWLTDFAEAFHELCDYYTVQLIGGDTTRGPLSITVTAHGQVPEGSAIMRSGAKAGDMIYVTGQIGDAALALKESVGEVEIAPDDRDRLKRRLDYPTPQVLAGQMLKGVASSAIDLSDGLIADLQHILDASHVGAKIDLAKLPLSSALTRNVSIEEGYRLAMTGGDDYELLFTVPPEKKGVLDTALANSGTKFTQIGQIDGNAGELKLVIDDEPVNKDYQGYDHFRVSAV